jgi:protein required for attachment to host cells
MLPMTRRDIEILLDTPDRRDYVVSAFVDLRVKDGFRRDVDVTLRNLAREANDALREAKARKSLEANIEPIVRAATTADPSAKGLAVYSSVARGLKHSVPLDFPVETRLVIDEEPFVLPLLEHWYATPRYLVARIDSHVLDLFEEHAGVTEPVAATKREIDRFQRDKPKFTVKKRLAQAWHERLQSLDQDTFFKEGAEAIRAHYTANAFQGIVLLGQPPITAAVRRMLPRELEHAVVEEHPQAMTDRAREVADEVSAVLRQTHARRTQRIYDELSQRWKEHHRVADGPTEVLDALQQGRAALVVLGRRRDMGGARCPTCGYRFGAPIGVCVYCQSLTRAVNGVQEILRLAMKQHVPVHVVDRNGPADPLEQHGGVVALLRAEANWTAPRRSHHASAFSA